MINDKEHTLSLYIHVPFCVRKCFYCDFLSAPGDDKIKENYIQALLQEITEKSENYKQFIVDSIFIGGGTPSILRASQISDIMRLIKKKFLLDEGAEISIEVNPGTVDIEKLQIYLESGINRLSIGLQSADNKELQIIGRIHTYEDFLQTYELARQVGFQNINVDLMSALPGQSIQSYQETVEKVLLLRPEHISSYSLIIEEGTPFFTRYEDPSSALQQEQLPPLPDEDTEREMYELTDVRLQASGYHRYEISNYARSGYACRHNIGYWRRHNYLGLGLGSSSLIENHRWNNEADLSSYLEGQFDRRNEQILTRKEQMEEFMFLGLRLMEGISCEAFSQYFGVSPESVYKNEITKLIDKQLLNKTEEGFFKLTKRGIDISNVFMAEFLL